jgi:hypothetical protein
MQLLIKVAAVLMLVSIAGCNKDEKQVEAPNPELLKTQRETLEQSRQVEQQVLDAADQQRQKIEAQTQ